jgi:hypothetical protein
VDLLHIPIGKGGGHEGGDLAVIRATIFVGNADGVGREKDRSAVVVIQLIQELLELRVGAYDHGATTYPLSFNSFA